MSDPIIFVAVVIFGGIVYGFGFIAGAKDVSTTVVKGEVTVQAGPFTKVYQCVEASDE